MRIRILAILVIAIGGVILGVWTVSMRSKQSPGDARAPEKVPSSANFTRGTATARKFGTHEIELTGNAAVSNPFDTTATVMFTPPSGQAVNVYAFYDGGN